MCEKEVDGNITFSTQSTPKTDISRSSDKHKQEKVVNELDLSGLPGDQRDKARNLLPKHWEAFSIHEFDVSLAGHDGLNTKRQIWIR